MRSPLLSAIVAIAAFSAAACGDANETRIDGPGARSQRPTKDGGSQAQGDAAPTFIDPKAPDGSCGAPNMVCNGACVATSSDVAHCGACGNACLGADSLCVASTCTCSGPQTDYCVGVGCMDVSSDFNNCGACGIACDPNNDDSCTGGKCVPK